jgi:hypothetical protein
MLFVFVNQISRKSIKSALKIITIAAALKSYSEIKDISSRKSWVCDLGSGLGGVVVPKWVYSCLPLTHMSADVMYVAAVA